MILLALLVDLVHHVCGLVIDLLVMLCWDPMDPHCTPLVLSPSTHLSHFVPIHYYPRLSVLLVLPGHILLVHDGSSCGGVALLTQEVASSDCM